MSVDLGDLYRLSFTLTDPDGTPVSADTMTLTITLPDATTSVQTVTPSSAGQYQVDYLTTQEGRHVARWVGSGTHPGAYVEAFDVLGVAPLYLISLADAKDQLKITGTASDDAVRGYIGSATKVIERATGQTAVKRSFTEGCTTTLGRVVLSHVPVVSVDSISSSDGTVTWDTTATEVNDAGILASTGTPLTGDLTVGYTAGLSIIPENYMLAAQIIIEHLWDTRRSDGPPRRAGMETTMVPGLGFAVPNRALELLGSGLSGVA